MRKGKESLYQDMSKFIFHKVPRASTLALAGHVKTFFARHDILQPFFPWTDRIRIESDLLAEPSNSEKVDLFVP